MMDFFKSEKAKELWKEIIRPVAIITAICLTVAMCLAVTNALTAGKIAERAKADEENAMRALIKADEYETIDKFSADMAENLSFSLEDITFTLAKKDNKVLGYIVKSSAKGYGGDVIVMTAIGTDGKITGVNILDVSGETPGLGQNAQKEEFYSQLIGKTSGVKVQKNSANPDNNEINAVTGATITSRAVEKAVDEAFEIMRVYTESEAK